MGASPQTPGPHCVRGVGYQLLFYSEIHDPTLKPGRTVLPSASPAGMGCECVFERSVFETSVFETSVFETSVFETSVFETSVFETSVFETSVSPQPPLSY